MRSCVWPWPLNFSLDLWINWIISKICLNVSKISIEILELLRGFLLFLVFIFEELWWHLVCRQINQKSRQQKQMPTDFLSSSSKIAILTICSAGHGLFYQSSWPNLNQCTRYFINVQFFINLVKQLPVQAAWACDGMVALPGSQIGHHHPSGVHNEVMMVICIPQHSIGSQATY